MSTLSTQTGSSSPRLFRSLNFNWRCQALNLELSTYQARALTLSNGYWLPQTGGLNENVFVWTYCPTCCLRHPFLLSSFELEMRTWPSISFICGLLLCHEASQSVQHAPNLEWIPHKLTGWRDPLHMSCSPHPLPGSTSTSVWMMETNKHTPTTSGSVIFISLLTFLQGAQANVCESPTALEKAA